MAILLHTIHVLSLLVWIAAALPQQSHGAWNTLHMLGQQRCTAIAAMEPTGYQESRRFLSLTNYDDRRSLLRKLTLTVVVTSPLLNAPYFLDSPISLANAQQQVDAMKAEQVAEWLHVVPMFALVDNEGVPYMVAGEDAKVTGYFFTTFEEAKRILQVALDSTEKSIQKEQKQQLEEPRLVNPWKAARISTIPLDVAVTLVTKSTKGNAFLLAPAAKDIEDALHITGLDDLSEGKVPLYYFKDFENSDGKSPLYFTKSQLLRDYDVARKKPGIKSSEQVQTDPPVLVTELFSILTEMVRGGNADVQNLVLVPPPTSVSRATECVRQGGKQPPFVLGERNLIL